MLFAEEGFRKILTAKRDTTKLTLGAFIENELKLKYIEDLCAKLKDFKLTKIFKTSKSGGISGFFRKKIQKKNTASATKMSV